MVAAGGPGRIYRRPGPEVSVAVMTATVLYSADGIMWNIETCSLWRFAFGTKHKSPPRLPVDWQTVIQIWAAVSSLNKY